MATQRGLVPGLTVPSYACVDIAGAPVGGTCQPGDWVRVTRQLAFEPVLPLLAAARPDRPHVVEQRRRSSDHEEAR